MRSWMVQEIKKYNLMQTNVPGDQIEGLNLKLVNTIV